MSVVASEEVDYRSKSPRERSHDFSLYAKFGKLLDRVVDQQLGSPSHEVAVGTEHKGDSQRLLQLRA